jgi:putative membrane protein
MSSFFAFLHHLAAFTVVAALAVELVLTKDGIVLKNARRILLADLAFGISAGVVLVVGLLRIVYFEKGTFYYFHSVPFVAKLSLFLTVGLLSIYPTIEFLSWRTSVKQEQAPTVTDRKMRAIRSIIHWELVGIVLIILCAALMAKGIGYLV